MKIHLILAMFLCLGALCFTAGTVEADSTEITSLVGPCEGCHGKDGASQMPQFPIIGGLSALYISDALAAFRDKTRLCNGGIMCQLASKISEQDASRIGEYFANKPFVRAKQSFDAKLADQGKAIQHRYCGKCHQNGGSLQADNAGILAGQWKPYLEQQFKELKSGQRLMPEMMKPKIDKLSDADIKALIEYFASFQ
jgi:sulfide dehydrogenase cytochrome subunit